MEGVVVKPVDSWGDRRQFVNLAWTLYDGDKNWIPPLRGAQRELLGYKRHPFHETAKVQTFLARRGKEVVGRIAAIFNHEHNRRYRENRGFFGFFESVDDQQVADALFAAARAWLKTQGADRVRGPVNPSMNYECGLLIEGFDSPPTFMMTYNPPYYGRLIENAGFHKARDLYAYIGRLNQLPALEKKLGPIADQAAERCQVTVRSMVPKRFVSDVRVFLDMYNQAMAQTWGFVPISDQEIISLGNSLKHLIVPELAVMAENENKRTVGAILGLLDFNPRIKAINGRLFPFGFITLLRNKHQIHKVRVLSINVVPEYQMWGLGLVLMRALVPKALAMGVNEAEFSWILEDNMLSRLGLEKGGAERYKTYRMYEDDPVEARPTPTS